MGTRYVSIWFPYLLTDWMCIRKPQLKNKALVSVAPKHGRLIIVASNALANKQGIKNGMVLADARALMHNLEVFDDKPQRREKLLSAIARWAIRYTPMSSTDENGLLLDVSGCCHLWGGESTYLSTIQNRLNKLGYTVKLAIADTIGAAWATARFNSAQKIIEPNGQINALLQLPPAALRLENHTIEKLQKLGFYTINRFINIQRSVLRRRFGDAFLTRLGQAMGTEPEGFNPIELIPEYIERLPCLEPIRTATAIEIAIQKLLEQLCKTLQSDDLGLRKAELKGYRIDGKIITSQIGTNKPSNNPKHLFKLLALNISKIAPGLGIELFTLEASKTEKIAVEQDKLWSTPSGLGEQSLAELLDRVAGKIGAKAIHRYLPQADYWPERAFKLAGTLTEKSDIKWHNPGKRPIQLLNPPEKIEVTAPIPDYPPMLFIYKGERHSIKKADGPERLERAWWLEKGEHRDYYTVEDETGKRYWLFRSGHYAAEESIWYIHGFFA
ncbi:Y-family DNA polymerase [Pedobacter sp. AW1-32]|uniref:Y-family DNA polymerase n=1 Tax=Pedobacter sp. AW1-32 TaxID=3383026 RepID=UPI003FF005EA